MKNSDYEKALELLRLGLKISKPDLTDEQADNIIVNLGNYVQFKRLNKKSEVITK